jgi:nucleotide-binding universal stress UspA family protein
MGVRHILFPTDFSPRCEVMVPLVTALARRFNAKVTILHVVESVRISSDFAPLEHHLATILEELRGKLEHYQEGAFHGITVDRDFRIGHAVDEIVAAANAAAPGFIVMPTHGRTRYRELLLGSVTAGVLHDTESPVLTAAHAAELPAFTGLPRTIVCAVDLSAESSAVLAAAAQFAAGIGANLRVVHALPSFGLAGGFANIEWEVQAQNRRKEYAAIAAAAFVSEPVEVIAGDSVNDAILAALKVAKADLLIIGRGKTQGLLGRLRTGAHDLIRRSHCPVLSI